MILTFFIVILTVFLFSSFTLTYRLQSINRVVLNTPISLFEKSIPLINYPEENNLYFDKEALRENLKSYYDENLEKTFKNYTMELYFYNQEDESICVNDKCNAVRVTVKGRFFYMVDVNREIKYEIHKGAKYGG